VRRASGSSVTAGVSPGATPPDPCRLLAMSERIEYPRRSVGGARPPRHSFYRRRRHRARHLARRAAGVRRHLSGKCPAVNARSIGSRSWPAKGLQAGGELASRGHAGRHPDARVAIKGPLTTPVGGGIRSLNVALRQLLDLYACVRPVRYFEGVPSPMREPQKLDVVIFRENILYS